MADFPQTWWEKLILLNNCSLKKMMPTLKELCQGFQKKAGIKVSICYYAIAQKPFNFN